MRHSWSSKLFWSSVLEIYSCNRNRFQFEQPCCLVKNWTTIQDTLHQLQNAIETTSPRMSSCILAIDHGDIYLRLPAATTPRRRRLPILSWQSSKKRNATAYLSFHASEICIQTALITVFFFTDRRQRLAEETGPRWPSFVCCLKLHQVVRARPHKLWLLGQSQLRVSVSLCVRVSGVPPRFDRVYGPLARGMHRTFLHPDRSIDRLINLRIGMEAY